MKTDLFSVYADAASGQASPQTNAGPRGLGGAAAVETMRKS
jgi:hypothetical protein